jgi:hypothetical protein
MKTITTLALLTLCTAAHALPIIGVDHGFVKGTDFRKGNPNERRAYVLGVIQDRQARGMP